MKQTSKQNTNRDIEIKNRLRVTRAREREDNKGKRGKGLQGTCIKNPWTKPKAGRIEGESGWGGRKGMGENGDNCT